MRSQDDGGALRLKLANHTVQLDAGRDIQTCGWLIKQQDGGLVSEGQAYRCYATKEELDRARAEHNAKNTKDPFVYPGWWRDRTDQPDRAYAIRFKSPREGSTDFVDKVFGPVTTPNSSQHDFVLLRSDGNPLKNSVHLP